MLPRIDATFLRSRARQPNGKPFVFAERTDSQDLFRPYQIAFTGSGRHLAVGNNEDHLFAIEISTGDTTAHELPNIRGLVHETLVGNGARDCEVLLRTRYFRICKGDALHLPLCPTDGLYRTPRYSPDGRLLIARSGPDYWSRARQFEYHPGGRLIDLASGIDHCLPTTIAGAWSRDGKMVACLTYSADPSATVVIRDRRGEQIMRLEVPVAAASDVAFHPDGKHIYVINHEALTLVELSTKRTRRIARGGKFLSIVANRFLVCPEHGFLVLRDLDGKAIATHEANRVIFSTAVSPYGHYVAIVAGWVVTLLRIHR